MIKLGSWLCIALMLLFPILLNAQKWHTVYIKSGNLYTDGMPKVFTEPFETLLTLCKNGDWFCFTTQERNVVRITPEWLMGYLKSKGHGYNDVILMIHNHFGYPLISIPNLRFLQILRNYGFDGLFCIIETASSKVVCVVR